MRKFGTVNPVSYPCVFYNWVWWAVSVFRKTHTHNALLQHSWIIFVLLIHSMVHYRLNFFSLYFLYCEQTKVLKCWSFFYPLIIIFYVNDNAAHKWSRIDSRLLLLWLLTTDTIKWFYQIRAHRLLFLHYYSILFALFSFSAKFILQCWSLFYINRNIVM